MVKNGTWIKLNALTHLTSTNSKDGVAMQDIVALLSESPTEVSNAVTVVQMCRWVT